MWGGVCGVCVGCLCGGCLSVCVWGGGGGLGRGGDRSRERPSATRPHLLNGLGPGPAPHPHPHPHPTCTQPRSHSHTDKQAISPQHAHAPCGSHALPRHLMIPRHIKSTTRASTRHRPTHGTGTSVTQSHKCADMRGGVILPLRKSRPTAPPVSSPNTQPTNDGAGNHKGQPQAREPECNTTADKEGAKRGRDKIRLQEGTCKEEVASM